MRNFATCEILQVAKFLQPYKIYVRDHFLLFSALFSFCLLTCSSDFGLDSSCLSRLNDFGIFSLQKTTKFSIKFDQKYSRDLNMPIGLIKLISPQNRHISAYLTIWALITPPNRHIASPLAMKERKREQTKYDQNYVYKKKCISKIM